MFFPVRKLPEGIEGYVSIGLCVPLVYNFSVIIRNYSIINTCNLEESVVRFQENILVDFLQMEIEHLRKSSLNPDYTHI